MKLYKLYFLYLILTLSYSAIDAQTGMIWEKNQAFPHFALPADTLDGFFVDDKSLSIDEKIMYSVLQGLVNKTKPSIYMLRPGGEGMYRWAKILDLKIREFSANKKWGLLKKYIDRIDGVILYDAGKSVHYRNLATTVAGLKNALPATVALYDSIRAAGFELPVIDNFCTLEYSKPEEIYRYLYDNYWKDCTKRLLISHHAPVFIRDIAAASGAAVVWLDPRKQPENEVIRLFLRDMNAGESIILGWWAEERSGVGIGTEYGISTVPADYYDNATVYAGMNHVINLPAVPRKPALENKIYLAVFLSDGDNIQYCQHTMPVLWDNAKRGSIPVNWTVSPSLADLGPQLLNYFYRTASQNDFLASGPSGLGYALIYDAHNRKWNNTGGETFDAYLRLTQNYLEKSGLRVITVWDQVNESQMEAYALYCRYLYGVTQQDWERQSGKIPGFAKRNRLTFLPNYPCYTETTDVFVRMNREAVTNFDGSRPVFLTAQGVSWKMGPDSLAVLKEKLERLSPGNIVFCRGDHFFALYNEANGMDFNLAMLSGMEITSSPSLTDVSNAADGSCAPERTWIAASKGKQWICLDFKQIYSISRYVIRNIEISDSYKSGKSAEFQIETSIDGKKWKISDRQRLNYSQTTVDMDIAPVNARYLRIVVPNTGNKYLTKIADIEAYGKQLKNLNHDF